MSQTEMTLRRAVLNIQHGQTKSVEIAEPHGAELKTYVEKFARSRKVGVSVTIDGSKLIIERVGNLSTTHRYGEMDGLAVGASHLFKVAIPEHAAVRRMASYRNRDGSGRVFRCTVDAGGLRVTRMPSTEAERQAVPLVEGVTRATKYGLERLETVGEIRFDVSRQEQQRLRMAVHKFAVKMDWRIRCRLQDDGSMLVVRLATGDAS